VSFEEDVSMWKRAWWRGFNAVQNDEGYRVKFIDRSKGIEYSEDGHVIRVAVETAAAEVDWIVYWRPLRAWCPPHEMESITDEKSQQIKQRILSGLNFLKVKFILLEP
jgi:hypothetical protein